MNTWLGLGSVFVLLLVAFVVARWPAKRLSGAYPASSMVFIAILFTSGLDVGLIMFPLTEFPIYANHQDNPEYRCHCIWLLGIFGLGNLLSNLLLLLCH